MYILIFLVLSSKMDFMFFIVIVVGVIIIFVVIVVVVLMVVKSLNVFKNWVIKDNRVKKFRKKVFFKIEIDRK